MTLGTPSQNRHKINPALLAVSSFIVGALAPFAAAKTLLFRPKLWIPTIIPWVIAGGLAMGLMSLALSISLAAGAWLLGALATGLGISATGWIATVVGWTLTALAWIVGALLLTWLASLLALPFADWLAELTEPCCEPPLQPATALSGWFSRAHARRLKLDLFKTLAGLLMTAAGLLLSAVPLLGVIGVGVLALGLAFQFLSYPQTRREMGLVASMGYLLRELPACLGFGLVLLAGFAIPFFSAFLFPLAVIGGTLLFGRLEGHKKDRSPEAINPGASDS